MVRGMREGGRGRRGGRRGKEYIHVQREREQEGGSERRDKLE